jgi:hypothetical protein
MGGRGGGGLEPISGLCWLRDVWVGGGRFGANFWAVLAEGCMGGGGGVGANIWAVLAEEGMGGGRGGGGGSQFLGCVN